MIVVTVEHQKVGILEVFIAPPVTFELDKDMVETDSSSELFRPVNVHFNRV